MRACETEVDTIEHFLLRCHFSSELFENFEKNDPNINVKYK